MANIPSDQIERIIDAAIDWEVLASPSMSGFLKQGGLYVQTSPTSGDQIIFPARGYTTAGLEGDLHRTVLSAEEFTLQGGQTAAQCYRKWEDRVYQLSYLFKTMPRAEDFQSAVDRFRPILDTLAIEPSMFATSDPAGQDYLEFEVTGNDQFSLVSSASAEFVAFQGLTSDAFRKYYLDRFPLITQRQYGVAQMLQIAVEGEQRVWKALTDDAETLFSEMAAAFDSRGASGGGGDLTVAGALLGLVAAIPGVNAAVGVVAGVVGVLATFTVPERDEGTYSLSADSAEGLWSKVESVVDQLKRSAADQERAMAEHMQRIEQMIVADPGSWDLGRIDDMDGNDTSASDELQDETDATAIIGTMALNFDIARQTGADLKMVAGEFRSAASRLGGVLSSGAWSRSGGIGMGYIGHFEETSALVDELVSILHGTDLGLQRAGDIIIIAADEIEAADGDATDRLTANKAKLDRLDALEATTR